MAKPSTSRTPRDEQEQENNNGYVHVLVTPLECSGLNVSQWFGLTHIRLTTQQRHLLTTGVCLLGAILVYWLVTLDLGLILQRICSVIVPLFSISSAFYWLPVYFRRSWNAASVYMLFIACFGGEIVGQTMSVRTDSYLASPVLLTAVLGSVGLANTFSSLDSRESAAVISFVSVIRFVAVTLLTEIPKGFRPFVAYVCGALGVVLANHMETMMRPAGGSGLVMHDAKIPAVKRRRTSSSGNGPPAFNHRGRRTSLPALGLIQKNQVQASTSSYDMALMGEAHGLITDMLANPDLPPTIVSGLRAVANLLNPPKHFTHNFQKPKMSPLLSLTETLNSSDTEENPYTGERPSSFPRRLRRSLPPNLLRRMSASTWTTTTSATGMPTLEPEPRQQRSASFRHGDIGATSTSTPSPGGATGGGGGGSSNSPSPSGTPFVSISIPKSRSFSLATMGVYGAPSRRTSHNNERKSAAVAGVGTAAPPDGRESDRSPSPSSAERTEAPPAELSRPEEREEDGSKNAKRKLLTSDYNTDSNDSPSSCEMNDAVCQPAVDDISCQQPSSALPACADKTNAAPAVDTLEPGRVIQEVDGVIFNLDQMDSCESVNRLSDWNYQIFDLNMRYSTTILSRLSYKVFQDVGLFETFKIPVKEFLSYFHAVEMGYHDKPYHNRMHAADVLHAVYYLTSQPIPGFQQMVPDVEPLYRQNPDGMVLLSRPSFQAEDSYGIVGGNFPALELMAMYTAAAMHDYDHPGRTNAFLVTTFAENAILYNDRSVLESHHAAAAWKLFLSDRRYNFLCHLEKAEFKRFRYIVIEAILATDLKRHFEFLADFNAKIEDETSCIDWNAEADRLLMLQMCIKLADINGPCKRRDLHVQWTERITDEFYEQGGEEAALGLPISPFMDRNNCQVAKLQESFINHLVAPLCTAYGNAGLLPGQWSESDVSDSESDVDISNGDSAKDDTTDADVTGGKEVKERCKVKKQGRKMWSPLSKHLKENHEHWVSRIKEEERSKDMSSHQDQPESDLKETEMETIVEETERSSVSSSVDNQKNEEVQDSGATSGDDGTFSPNKAEES